MEEASNGGDTADIFNEEGAGCEEGGRIACIIVPAARAVEGRAGLVEKKLGSTVEKRRGLIEPGNEEISISRQCELLGISRSGFYYKAIGEDAYNLELMKLIDEYYTGHPFYGVRRLMAWLRREGHEVNHKRANRLMREMGLYALYPRPGLSKGGEGHRKYPYLVLTVGQLFCRTNHP